MNTQAWIRTALVCLGLLTAAPLSAQPADPGPAEPAAEPAAINDPEAGLIADEPVEPEPAAAQDPDLAVDAELAMPAQDEDSPGGLFLITGKIGGQFSLNGLNPYLHGGLELGYVFPALDQGIGVMLAVEYSAPRTDGSVSEDFDPERVPGGGYDWKLLQKELVLMPTFLYRMTFLSDLVTPYAGLGVRVYLLESKVSAKAGDQTIDETEERSTKVGFGIPLGAEFALGPGAIIGELMFQWGPFEHTLTGDTNLGGLSVFAGYRLLL